MTKVFHCDGILLCTTDYCPRFVVWNPLTGETRWFRSSKIDPTVVLGYDNNSSYKLLLCDCRGDNAVIYEFDTDSWKVLDGSILPPGYDVEYSILYGVSLKGYTYWLADDTTKSQPIMCLLKFDFSIEKALPVPLPSQCIRFEARWASSLSVVRDKKLAVLLQQEDMSEIEIWVTNKIDKTTKDVVSWSKVLALDLSPGFQIRDDATFLLDEEKKIYVYCHEWLDLNDDHTTKVVIHIIGEDKVTEMDFGLDLTGVCPPAILTYVPSLVQLKQAGAKRKRAD